LSGSAGVEAGSTTASVEVIQIDGPIWGAGYDPDDQQITPFGTITVRYPNCDSAIFSIQTDVELEDQTLSMIRLTQPIGVTCTNPPADNPALTPGAWEGNGVCIFVAPDGKSITDVDSTCPNGGAFWMDQQGIELNVDDHEIGTCVADVTCESEWIINDNGHVNCVNERGAVGHIEFETSQAAMEGIQGLIGVGADPTACLASGVAYPPQ